MKKWPIYSDFSILSHNSGNFGQNEKQVLFSEGGTSGTEPNRFRESSSVMCQNVVYQWSASEHCPTIPFQAHCVLYLKCFQVKHLLETNMEKGMLNYNETGYDGVTHTWDIIQTEVGG